MKLQAKVQQLVAKNVPTIAFTMENKQLTAMGVKTALERMKTNLHTITGFELLKMVQSLLVEGDGEQQQLEFAKFVFPVFPMLPFPLTSEDWDWRLLRDTLTAYMNILGWKVGGNSYTDKTNIPPGWPNSMDYNDFKGPSGAKTSEAKIIIRSLLVHHGYDPDVHHVPVTENNNNNNNKKRRARKNRSKTSAAIIEDEERRIEDETGDADRNEDEDRIVMEDRRENMMEDRSENVMEDRREDTANGENTAPRLVTVGILTDMNEGEEYMDMAVDLDSVPMLLEDGEGQHYVHADVVQLHQDGGGDSQKGEDTAPGEDLGGENIAPRIVNVAAVEAARSMILHGAVDDVNISTRRLSLPTISVDRTDPGAYITWPIAINPDFLKNYPSKSQMRSWPWPSTSSTPPPLQNDQSDKEEESAYEKLQRKNIQEKEKKLADLGIASEVTNAKKPRKRKTKNIPSSSEPIRKSRR